jgi:hypothetical protein
VVIAGAVIIRDDRESDSEKKVGMDSIENRTRHIWDSDREIGGWGDEESIFFETDLDHGAGRNEAIEGVGKFEVEEEVVWVAGEPHPRPKGPRSGGDLSGGIILGFVPPALRGGTPCGAQEHDEKAGQELKAPSFCSLGLEDFGGADWEGRGTGLGQKRRRIQDARHRDLLDSGGKGFAGRVQN